MFLIAQDLGMTVFLAIGGTLYQNFALRNVAPVLPNTSPGEIANLIAGTSSQTYKALSQEAKDLVIPQITDAMRNLWLFFLVGATLSFVLSVFLGVSHLCSLAWEYCRCYHVLTCFALQRTRLSLPGS